MPDAAASDGLSEIARVALPMRERVSQSAKAMMTTTRDARSTTMSMTLSVTTPNSGMSSPDEPGSCSGAAADEELEV